jgi:CRISPR-associated protein Cas6
MYWQDDSKTKQLIVDDEVVDLVFGMDCRCLPVDHAYALSQAVQDVLPWLPQEPSAGVHSIHVAASSNGWVRPQAPDALLHLSRRTRLVLRVPRQRIAQAQQLAGRALEVGGQRMAIKQASVRPLSTLTTLFTRHFATADNLTDEDAVLKRVVDQLRLLGITPRKLLCGAAHAIGTPQGDVHVRSVMIADLEPAEAVRLQQQGIGPYRAMGCGLFIPHKHIHDVRDE